MPELSPAERRIVRLLLSGPKPEQFETAAALAAETRASAPTVVRCLAKLGFPSYAAFREAARREAGERRQSALKQMESAAYEAGEGPRRDRLFRSFLSGVDASARRLDDEAFDRAVDLLVDTSRRQIFAGGRFSNTLAELLYGHAHLIRSGCDVVPFTAQSRVDRLADVGRGHVATLFDFRRYQRDTVEVARELKRRRAKLILVTDPWMSPIADWADVVLAADVQSTSAFDTFVPALAITEALIAAMYERLGAAASKRLAGFEALNKNFEWRG